MKATCPKCGAQVEVKASDLYCWHCGAKLTVTAVVTTEDGNGRKPGPSETKGER